MSVKHLVHKSQGFQEVQEKSEKKFETIMLLKFRDYIP